MELDITDDLHLLDDCRKARGPDDHLVQLTCDIQFHLREFL